MNLIIRCFVRCLLGIPFCVPSLSHAEEPLRMVFRSKPPYSYIEDGVQKGFLLEKTEQILKAGGVKARFSELPLRRIFQDIQLNQERICSFGWYKNPEREAYARFSLAMHQDRPHLVLTHQKSAEKIKRLKTLKDLMGAADLTLTMVDSVSYGPEIDAMIAAFPGSIDKAPLSPQKVAEKLAAERADFMFMDRDDYEFFKATTPTFPHDALIVVSVPDAPAGLQRYILCSKKVSPDTMNQINTGIGLIGKTTTKK